MKVWGQIERAQLENKGSDYATTIVGLIWINTSTLKVMLDDGTTIRAMLRNDGKAIIGNSGTAAQNIRFHRGAAGVLQLVSGADVTAEGTLSTSLNQLSMRLENYTTAARPAAGNAGRKIWDTDLVASLTDSGAAWVQDASGSTTTRVNAVWDIVIGSAAQVTSGAATHSTWASAISAASSGNTIRILEGSWTESPSISKQLYIEGSGYGSLLTGTITFTSGSLRSRLTGIRTTQSIVLNSGSNLNAVDNVWLASGKTFTDSGTGNLLQGFQET